MTFQTGRFRNVTKTTTAITMTSRTTSTMIAANGPLFRPPFLADLGPAKRVPLLGLVVLDLAGVPAVVEVVVILRVVLVGGLAGLIFFLVVVVVVVVLV